MVFRKGKLYDGHRKKAKYCNREKNIGLMKIFHFIQKNKIKKKLIFWSGVSKLIHYASD